MEAIFKPGNLPDGDLWDGGEQIPRILLSGVAEQALRLGKFNQFSGSHHGHTRGDLRDHRQTVRNEYIREAEFAL